MQVSKGEGSFLEKPERAHTQVHSLDQRVCFQKVTKQPVSGQGLWFVGLSGNRLLRLLSSLVFCLS